MNTEVKSRLIYDNLGINPGGHLTFAGKDTVELAARYGTPAMIIDEDRLRANCRVYTKTMKDFCPTGSTALYASKALCFRRLYTVIAAEGMGIDLVSSGELYTAKAAGFPLENAYFHGNNKTDADIAYAVECGVGRFVIDSREEALAVNRFASKAGIRQKVLLRLTPGIDPHTHAAVTTGKVDSKFGTPIETGQAASLVAYLLTLDNLELTGFHCHVGSQSFDSSAFRDAADIMIDFIARMRTGYGLVTRELDLGGGYGVRYTDRDPEIDIADNIKQVSSHVRGRCRAKGISTPKIILEPGRSIVADTCITLYTVGSVKTVNGYKNFVSVDGGMTDNPRYALYGSEYSVYNASRASQTPDFTADVVGRCCESGDIIQPAVNMARPERGHIIAVAGTGAYNYSMASNYNRLPRPPIVMIRGGRETLAVRRETYADMMLCDM